MMRVLKSGERLILKALMSQNKTFGIKLNMMENKFLANVANKDE
jgi:hypothetical protein